MKNSPLLKIIITILLLLYVYTAISKLIDLTEFTKQLANQMIPKAAVPLLAWAIPVSELVTCLLLIRTATTGIGMICSSGLLLVFTIYMALVVLNIFDRTPCGCGGVISSMGFGAHLAFNIFFLTLSIMGTYIFYSFKPKAVTPRQF